MLQDKFQTKIFLNNCIEQGGLRTKNILKNSKENKNLISVLTVVKNGDKFLEESILSLKNQTYSNYEHIIVDGGSTDDTLKIIKKYEEHIDYWCSEKDNGLYFGFNKALLLARGKYVGFLNSDDVLTKNCLELLNNYINKNLEADFFFGAVKKHWGVLYGYKPWKIKFSWGFYSSHSTGFFIKLTSAKKLGFYNTKYKYSSDYDYFYRMIVKCKMKGVGTKKDEIFGVFRRGGFSSTINFKDHFFEEIRIRIDNGQNKLLVFLIFIYKFIRNFKKIILNKGDKE
jgi:glycosyltransferase involved in cell wall biosynthesis